MIDALPEVNSRLVSNVPVHTMTVNIAPEWYSYCDLLRSNMVWSNNLRHR